MTVLDVYEGTGAMGAVTTATNNLGGKRKRGCGKREGRGAAEVVAV